MASWGHDTHIGRTVLGKGSRMGISDERARVRDEIYSLLLAGVGVVVVLSYAAANWRRGSEAADNFDAHRSHLRCDLNALSSEELQTLPGVGSGLAGRIVDHRSQIGGYTTIEQLSEVPGIGPGRLSNLRAFLFVSGEIDSSDRKDVPANERPISVASAVSTSGRPAQSH